MDNFYQAVQKFSEQKEPKTSLIPGEIGIVINGNRVTEVPGRGSFVYVRIRSNLSEIVQAFNNKVFPGYGLPVLLQWKNGRYEVFSRDSQRYPQWEEENPHLPKHGQTHILDVDGRNLGDDPVWVYPYQFMPLLVSPFNVGGVQNVYIHPHPIHNPLGELRFVGNTGTPSFAPYKPISGSVVVLVALDTRTGNPALFASTGTYIPPSTTGTVELAAYLPASNPFYYLPLSFIELQSGTTQIGWENIHDLRQFSRPFYSGSSYLRVNTVFGIDYLQFSGANIIGSGTVAFIEIATSGGGAGGVYDFHEEGALVSGSSIDVPYLVTSPFNADNVYLYCENLGQTGTTVADVKKNGMSIFTGVYPTLPYNSTGSWVSQVPVISSFVKGDILSVQLLNSAQGAQNTRIIVAPQGGGSGGISLTVEEADGAPSVNNVDKIIVPNTSLTSLGGGDVKLKLPGEEVSYNQFTSNVTISSTTEAGANTIVTSDTINYDGSTTIIIEFYSTQARPDTGAAGRNLSIWLFEDGSSIGLIGHMQTPAAGADNKPILLRRRLTPTSGSHTYSIRGSVSAGNGLVAANVGGAGTDMPGYIRIIKV